MRAHRNTRRQRRRRFLERLFQKYGLLEPAVIDAQFGIYDPKIQVVHPEWIFQLKEPTADEKGVLLVMFNDTYEKLRAWYDIEAILKDYFLVLEPSVSMYCLPQIMQFLRYKDHPIIIQATERLDYEFLERLNSNLLPVDFGASDWNNDKVFVDLGLDRIYDCVMVAMWNDVKRHHVLLRAVRDIGDPSYRLALAGVDWNMTADDIRDIARFYGVDRQVDIFEGYGHPEINRLYNQSRVQVLLSLREGSNKTLFEGFFTNTPAILIENNIGVNKSYINEQTGKLVSEKELPYWLNWFRDHYRDFSPREWAMQNISCPVTSEKLERALQRVAAGAGEPWTRPIAVKVNKGSYPRYYYPDQKLPPFDDNRYRLADSESFEAASS
jgi:hypothetical protein